MRRVKKGIMSDCKSCFHLKKKPKDFPCRYCRDGNWWKQKKRGA